MRCKISHAGMTDLFFVVLGCHDEEKEAMILINEKQS